MANSAPEKTFRVGSCSASVFKNVVESKNGGGKRTLRTVVLQRAYYDDKNEKWEHTNSFALGELAQAQRVLALAQQYVESIEADTTA